MATLNTAGPTTTFTVTAGATYVIAATAAAGAWPSGTLLRLETALAGSDTVFAPVEGGEFIGPFSRFIGAPGTKLKATISAPGGVAAAASINIESTLAT